MLKVVGLFGKCFQPHLMMRGLQRSVFPDRCHRGDQTLGSLSLFTSEWRNCRIHKRSNESVLQFCTQRHWEVYKVHSLRQYKCQLRVFGEDRWDLAGNQWEMYKYLCLERENKTPLRMEQWGMLYRERTWLDENEWGEDEKNESTHCHVCVWSMHSLASNWLNWEEINVFSLCRYSNVWSAENIDIQFLFSWLGVRDSGGSETWGSVDYRSLCVVQDKY